MKVDGKPGPLGSRYTIQFDPGGLEGGAFVVYCGDPAVCGPVARGPSAKALSKWAFEQGADSVRHDYDLKHGEP